jgi:hypothetical protein
VANAEHSSDESQQSDNEGYVFSHLDTFSLTLVLYNAITAINYGDWDFDNHVKYVAPQRSVDWLVKYGMCIDNIRIQQATDPAMGRGAFAAYNLLEGTRVAPMPMQFFPDRSKFTPPAYEDRDDLPESIFVNYCYSPRNSSILLFPHAPGVNVINHKGGKQANVAIRWSDNYMHHKSWLDLPFDELKRHVYAGALVMDLVALRDIEQGEELFLDYGHEWEEAWEQHVQAWQPVERAEEYVYPAEMDDNEPLRTLDEQKTQPYPSNLHLACYTRSSYDRRPGTSMKWVQPDFPWPEGSRNCEILKRVHNDETGEDLYDVILNFDRMQPDADLNLTRAERIVDTGVPRHAIRWVERVYEQDVHLPNVFRHPIMMPDDMVPPTWRGRR